VPTSDGVGLKFPTLRFLLLAIVRIADGVGESELHQWKKMNVFGLKHLENSLPLRIRGQRHAFGQERRVLGIFVRVRTQTCFFFWFIRLHLEKPIRGAHDSRQVGIVLRGGRIVMVFKNVHEGGHQIPGQCQPPADRAVVHSEILLLQNGVIHPASWRKVPTLGFFLLNDHPKGKLTDVMQQAGQIGLFLLGVVQEIGDPFA